VAVDPSGLDPSGIITRLASRHCLSNFAAIGTGVESQVFAADSEQWGRVAIKLPLRDSSYVSLNDPDATNERLFQQEHLLLNYLEKSGFPSAPRSFIHGDVCGLPYVILEYLDADPASHQDAAGLGRTLARLHRVPLPDLELSAQEAMPVPELIPARLTRRFDAYRRLSGSRAALPRSPVMAGALTEPGSSVALLHLDVRSVNIIWSASNGPKLLDWSNSVLGPPQLELARLAEIGDLPADEVAQGYRAEGGEVTGSPDSELIFRLDAAVMLALVFLSEGADPELASGMVRRVDELAAMVTS
jgi:aminoglycoside phosphotransferase (APT) family kinase protein